LADARKVAIGQLIMHGRQHLVGIKALEGGLVLFILRYPDELRDFTPYFEGINTKAEPEAVGLAKELIEAESGRFEPEKIPNTYALPLALCNVWRKPRALDGRGYSLPEARHRNPNRAANLN
jgi:DNA end-binding protein Ku